MSPASNAHRFAMLETALKLAGERSWQDITMIDIAEAADTPLSELYSIEGKLALAKDLEAWADLAMSADACDAEDTPREQLFDVIMRRFETFETQRAGVLSLMKWRDRSPVLRARMLRARAASANWALACCGLDTSGPLEARATSIGLAWVIGQTERAWRQDDSGDFARTMATLDAELLTAEERLSALKRLAPNRKARSAKAATPDTPEAPPSASDEA